MPPPLNLNELPESLAATLQHIVGQLDVLTQVRAVACTFLLLPHLSRFSHRTLSLRECAARHSPTCRTHAPFTQLTSVFSSLSRTVALLNERLKRPTPPPFKPVFAFSLPNATADDGAAGRTADHQRGPREAHR